MIKLVSDTIDKDDIKSLVEWLSQEDIPRLTKGEVTKELEEKWAKKLGTTYSVFVNSGSSAILLTLATLLHTDKLKNKRIVVPNLSWVTDVSSPMLLGMDPILCDANFLDFSLDLEQLEVIFNEQSPSAVILVSVLGLVPNMEEVVRLCKEYDVMLLEDVCESMGSKYQDKNLGTFGEASFFSMYYGHHLSTIEGGFINTDNEELYHNLLMMRSHGWDRDLPAYKQKQLREENGVSDFDGLYTFYLPGMNVRSTDLQAFIGLKQIDKLDEISEKRNKNFKLYQKKLFGGIDIEYTKDSFVSNFAFPLINPNRKRIVEELIKNDIEVRPLIAGSMSEKPFWKNKYGGTKYIMKNTEIISKKGFYVPNHQDLTEDEIDLITNIINEYGRT